MSRNNIKVLDPGHVYQLPDIDHDHLLPRPEAHNQYLVFIKRSGGAIQYEDEHHGTNVQSVVRVLIDRTKYLDSIIPAVENADVLYHLRMVLLSYEGRAWRRKLDKVNRGADEHHSFRERDKDLPFDELGLKSDPDRDGIENCALGDDGHILI